MAEPFLALAAAWLGTHGGLVSLGIRFGETRQNLLETSEVRSTILRVVSERPGIPLGELLNYVDAGWGTLYHHLNRLSRAGLIRTVTVGRRRLVYPASPSGKIEADANAHGLLHGDSARRIAEAIAAKPHRSLLDIAEELDESPRVVYYHVRRLIGAGLVTSISETRYRGLAPTLVLMNELQRAAGDAVADVPSPGPQA